MENTTIQKTNRRQNALSIARSLPGYFDAAALGALAAQLESHELFGAFTDDVMVAFLTLRPADAGAVEIVALGVLPGPEKKGLGARLVREILAFKAVEGYRLCYVKVPAEDAGGAEAGRIREFYQQLGFQRLETAETLPASGKEGASQVLAAVLPLGKP
jgi:ribosomal protein S18 acetylase RimI-like enzyme